MWSTSCPAVEDRETRFPIGAEGWIVVVEHEEAPCRLPAGHEGPHEFTPMEEIVVEKFPC